MEIEQIVNDCNKTVRYLSQHTTLAWKDVLENALTESEYETNLDTISRAVKAQGVDPDHIRAIASGTGHLTDEVGLSTDEGRRVIKILKDTGHIIQCGRGRGKAIIVLRTDAVKDADVKAIVKTEPAKQVEVKAPEQAPVPVITTETDEKANIAEVLNSAAESVVSLQDRVAELETLVERKDEEISTLKSKLDEAQQKLDTQHLTSWT